MNLACLAVLLQPLPQGPLVGQSVSLASPVEVVLRSTHDASQTIEPVLPVAAYAEESKEARHGERTGLLAGIDGYLPASRLTERPQLIRDIDPEWRLPGMVLPVVTGTLLINEYGDVDRVELDTPSLSPMLALDIRSRFIAARFTPGKLNGSAVKTLLRFEVRLD
jgi:hypothetical protein